MEKALYALKDGLLDGGACVITGFPGYKAHDLFALCGNQTISVNEKVAYEIAWGASFAGKRSVVMFKNVGMNAAADPFINSLLIGANAGLVVIVVDDTIQEASQSNQDSRPYSSFFGGLWLEPYSLQSAYDLAYASFSYSEKTNMPVVIRVTSDLLRLAGLYKRKEPVPNSSKKLPQGTNLVTYPTFSQRLRKRHEKNLQKVQSVVNTLYKNLSPKLLASASTLRFGATLTIPPSSFIQLFSYPLPEQLTKLAKNKKLITIVETGGDFGKKLFSTFLQRQYIVGTKTPPLPKPADTYQKVIPLYEKLFTAINNFAPQFISLDLGQFTHTPLSIPQTALCFGASEAIALGAKLAGVKRVLCVTGDTTYMHSGKDVLPEILKRNQDVSIVVLQNGKAASSGGQVSPGELSYPNGFSVYRANYERSTIKEITSIFLRMEKDNSPSILFLEIHS